VCPDPDLIFPRYRSSALVSGCAGEGGRTGHRLELFIFSSKCRRWSLGTGRGNYPCDYLKLAMTLALKAHTISIAGTGTRNWPDGGPTLSRRTRG
jgi:hypothetical protein